MTAAIGPAAGPETEAAVDWTGLRGTLHLDQMRGLACAWCAHMFGPACRMQEAGRWHGILDRECTLWACADRQACQARWEARQDMSAARMRAALTVAAPAPPAGGGAGRLPHG
ncbi:hypothetical protein [Streptomyces sp. YIM 98790]|uniref:hypothetical protein n=1 Tax=Streptomyces sp. YIM 98790 TaxID=2689077 RepID=UPI00140E7A21|nr:hypothetical protein [Streptomyces sp. YIM 98790]